MPSGASYWPGRGDVPGQRVQREAGRLLATHRPEPVDAVEHDRRHAGDRLDVVDHRRARVQAGHRGERRPQPGLAATALQRVEQRGLLTADVGARAGVHDQFEVVAGAADVAAQVTRGVGLGDRGLQPAQHRHHLAAHVDERVVRADRVRRDDHALDQEVRRGQHQRNVFARTGFRLVGVDHQVVRFGAGAGVVLRDEGPFVPVGKPAPPRPRRPESLTVAMTSSGAMPSARSQRLVAVVATVGVQRPGLGLVPEPAQHGRQCGHAFESVASGRFGFLRFGRHGAAGAGPARSFVASAATFGRSGRRANPSRRQRPVLPCRVRARRAGRPAWRRRLRRAAAACGSASRRGCGRSPGRCTAARPRVGVGGCRRADRRRGRAPTPGSGCRRTPS